MSTPVSLGGLLVRKRPSNTGAHISTGCSLNLKMTNKYQTTSNVNINNYLDIGFNPLQRYEAVAPLYIETLEASDRQSGPISYQPLIPVP